MLGHRQVLILSPLQQKYGHTVTTTSTPYNLILHKIKIVIQYYLELN